MMVGKKSSLFVIISNAEKIIRSVTCVKLKIFLHVQHV